MEKTLVGKGSTRKFEQEEKKEGRLLLEKRKEGVKNLQLVEDRNLNSCRVRYFKHDPIIHFKFDYELMP
jgi:hypothetical protein